MGKLIDADKLKAHYGWWKGKSKLFDEVAETFDEIIDSQPTVEPSGMVVFREGDKLMHIDQDALVELWRMKQRGELTEPKHGRWISEHLASTSGGSYAVVRCSVCKAQFPMYKTNYCPNCGARMMDESEERKNYIDLGNGFSITANGARKDEVEE